jgi:hypothetical protein
MESFFNLLRWQCNRPACWFNVQYSSTSTHDNTLSRLFKKEPEAFFEDLSQLGLAYKQGSETKWRIRSKLFRTLGERAELSNFECALFSINGQRNAVYLRLGFFVDGAIYNPTSSDGGFSKFEDPPEGLVSEYNSAISVLSGKDKEIRTVPEEEKEEEDATNENQTPVGRRDLQLRVLDLLWPLLSKEAQELSAINKLWSPTISDDLLEAALAPLVKKQHNQRMEQHSQEYAKVASPESHEILFADRSLYPVLEQYNIPLQKASIVAILYDVIKLQKNAFLEHGTDIFTLKNPTYPRQMMRLVLVKQANNSRAFFRNARVEGNNNWLMKIIDALSFGNNNSRNDCVLLLLYWYGREFRDTFLQCCSKLNIRVVRKVMDPETSQSCWNYSGIGDSQQKKLLRFFSFFYKWRFTCSSQKQRALLPVGVPQVTGDFIDVKDGKKKYYYTKAIDQCLVMHLNNFASRFDQDDEEHDEARKLNLQDVTHVDVLFSGDHGQGSSKFTVKFILRNKTEQSTTTVDTVEPEPYTFIERVGQIDCRKDSRELIQRTVAGEFNISLDNLAREKKLYLFSSYLEKQLYVSLINEMRDSRDSLVKTYEIWLGMTGDLAWYSMVLGKENMAGDWCWRCMLALRHWQDFSLSGRNWTIKRLRAHLKVTEAIRLIRKPTPYEVCGVTAEPMFPAIECDNYMYPVLHALQLNVNHGLTNFHKFTDYMVENIPDDILAARIVLEKRSAEYEECIVELRELESEHRRNTKQWRLDKLMWTDRGRQAINQEEKLIISVVMAEIRRKEKVSQEEKASMAEVAKAVNSEKAAAKKKLDSLDKRAVMDKTIRMQMEAEVLDPNGVERCSYHGGEVIGRGAMNLLRKAGHIFDHVETFLLNVPAATRHPNCTDEMIATISRAHCRLFQYYNGLRFLARKRNGTATNDDCDVVDKGAELTAKLEQLLFGSLSPKMHAKKHLQVDFRKKKGLGLYGEDHMEQDHQRGKEDEIKTKGIRSRSKAFGMHAVYGERRNLVDALGITEKMIKGTSRAKRRRTADGGDEEANGLSMDEWVRVLFDLPEIEYTLGTVATIIKNNRRNPNDEEETEEEESIV